MFLLFVFCFFPDPLSPSSSPYLRFLFSPLLVCLSVSTFWFPSYSSYPHFYSSCVLIFYSSSFVSSFIFISFLFYYYQLVHPSPFYPSCFPFPLFHILYLLFFPFPPSFYLLYHYPFFLFRFLAYLVFFVCLFSLFQIFHSVLLFFSTFILFFTLFLHTLFRVLPLTFSVSFLLFLFSYLFFSIYFFLPSITDLPSVSSLNFFVPLPFPYSVPPQYR